MSQPVPSSIAAHFRQLPYPRVRRTRRHALEDILVITLCAVICDAEAHAFTGTPHTTAEIVDGDHGRIGVRRAGATDDLVWLADRPRWPGLRSVVRSHCAIENGLHWVLDVAMHQDQTRIRTGHAQDNLAILQHIALNLLKLDRTEKLGIKNRRLAAGWDHDYLVRMIMGARN